MSGFEVRPALLGESVGFVSGITWLPDEALQELARDTEVSGPADALATLVSALNLDFAFVPASEPWAAEALRSLRGVGAASLWSVAGVLGRVGDRVGWVDTLRMTVAEPGALAVHTGEVLHDALDEVRRGLAEGADAIVIADDLAGAMGPLVAPDYALDALVPCYRMLAHEAVAHDVPAVFHSDGDIRIVLPALKRAGFCSAHLAGLAGNAFLASHAVARSAGLTVLGGVEVASLGLGARRLGAHAGLLALAGGMLVCDDGGIASTEEVAAYASALDAARETYAAGSTDVEGI